MASAVPAACLADSLAAASNIWCSNYQYQGLSSLPTDIEGVQLDAWCQAVCNQYTGEWPGFCPNTLCECANGVPSVTVVPPEISTSTTPPKCFRNRYESNPGTLVTDEFCQQSCTSASEPFCPRALCRCKSPCDPGLVPTFSNYDDLPRSTLLIRKVYRGVKYIDGFPVATDDQFLYDGRVASRPHIMTSAIRILPRGSEADQQGAFRGREDIVYEIPPVAFESGVPGKKIQILQAAVSSVFRENMVLEISGFDKSRDEDGAASRVWSFRHEIPSKDFRVVAVDAPSVDFITMESFNGTLPDRFRPIFESPSTPAVPNSYRYAVDDAYFCVHEEGVPSDQTIAPESIQEGLDMAGKLIVVDGNKSVDDGVEDSVDNVVGGVPNTGL